MRPPSAALLLGSVRDVDDQSAAGGNVTVTFQITEKEFIQGCQRGYRRSIHLLVLVPATFVVGLIATNGLRTHHSILWIVVLVLTFGYWPWFILLQPRWTFSRKSTARELRTITYSRAGSHHQGQTYSLDRPWSRYRGVFEYPDMYLLRYRGGNTNTLPKRALASHQDDEAFRSIASSHVRCHFLAA